MTEELFQKAIEIKNRIHEKEAFIDFIHGDHITVCDKESGIPYHPDDQKAYIEDTERHLREEIQQLKQEFERL